MEALSNRGTDIVITKVLPESHYGEGYLVEIYDYGKKTNEFHAKTKKEVEKIIKTQKNRYNTDRAFQNGLQLHVDYKVDEALQKLLKSSSSKNEVVNMDIDTILMKKASRIGTMISRLEDPTLPVKILKEAQESNSLLGQAVENQYSTAPVQETQTPAPTPELDENTDAANKIKEELVKYFQNRASSNILVVKTGEDMGEAPGIPENDLKHWFSSLYDLFMQKNAEGHHYDIKAIIQKLKELYRGSGLPGEEFLMKPVQANFEANKVVSELDRHKEDYAKLNEIIHTPEAKEAAEVLKDAANKTESEMLLTKLFATLNKYENANRLLQKHYSAFLGHIKNYTGINTLDNVYAIWKHEQKLDPIFANALKSIIDIQLEKRFSAVRTAKTVNSIYRNCAEKIGSYCFVTNKLVKSNDAFTDIISRVVTGFLTPSTELLPLEKHASYDDLKNMHEMFLAKYLENVLCAEMQHKIASKTDSKNIVELFTEINNAYSTYLKEEAHYASIQDTENLEYNKKFREARSKQLSQEFSEYLDKIAGNSAIITSLFSEAMINATRYGDVVINIDSNKGDEGIKVNDEEQGGIAPVSSTLPPTSDNPGEVGGLVPPAERTMFDYLDPDASKFPAR